MGAFSVFKGKTKEETKDSGAYYRRLKTAFTICKLCCMLGVILLVLYGFSFRTDEINRDNFRYLLNSLGNDQVQSSEYQTLYFDSNDNNRFVLVRGDLAVVNSSGSSVYTLSGTRQSADSTLRMDNPELMSSAKFMYIYDLGGTELVVKNTLETVKTINYNYPIRAAAAADTGYFAVVSSEKTTRSTVFVYDDKYREVYKCSFGSQYTLSVDLGGDATRLLTASVFAEGGDYVTEVAVYSLSEKEPLVRRTVKGEYPYKACFTDSGFALLTDVGCHFYDGSGEELSFLAFGDEGIDTYYMDRGHFIRQYSTSTMTSAEELEVYDSKGNAVYKHSFADGVRFASCDGDYLFVISGINMLTVRLEDGEVKTTPAQTGVLKLLPVGDKKVLVLTEGTGNVFDYGALFIERDNEETEDSEE